jgi:8-oxo-dGTP diphosphatase
MKPASKLKISTLIYCFNASGEILLLQRTRPPNQGLWSPPGGKLDQETGESPHTCAAREAREELGIKAIPSDFNLKGIVSETGHEGEHHWMMFLFEYGPRLSALPPEHPEGSFQFFPMKDLENLNIPETDRIFIWPLVKKHKHGFFVAECDCHEDGTFAWRELESFDYQQIS